MRRRSAGVLATAVAVGIFGPNIPASAEPLGMSGTGSHSPGSGHSGTLLRSGGANHNGGSGLRSYGHTYSRHDLGSHQNSGWYQRGWGGTANPGWDYRFAPNLGGPGH
jgi:hypothetical protein